MTTSAKIKELVLNRGADLCGIAPVERFSGAPEGFHPRHLLPNARSVIVFAKKLPESIYFTNSFIPYSFIDDIALHEVLRLSFDLAVQLEKMKILALPVPSEPYEYWDKENMTGKGLISLKHAGYLAGLGRFGKNSLLNNPQYGNLIKLGALVTDAKLEGDPILAETFCSENCRLCIDHCPSGALGGDSVLQKNCRLHSEGSTAKGAPITVCNTCRKICPNRAGWIRKCN